mmetsp:Transcript_36281/g.44762  ORF Transcript_36281/g.44762 Transcript_36281/m.44762 type:complete len:213 (-) Transcript_36281:252-890(-)
MQRVVTWESVVVLVVAAHWCAQSFCQLHGLVNGAGQNDARAVQNHRKLGLGEELGRLPRGRLAAAGALQLDARGQREVHHLRPEVARDVDLRRSTAMKCLLDHTIQDLANARVVPDLLLVAHAIFEHRHLFHFLESTLTDGLVRRLRGHQQQWGVVPIGRLHGRDEVRDARTVLSDHHGHLSSSSGVSICHHACIAFMGTVPKFDACSWEQI